MDDCVLAYQLARQTCRAGGDFEFHRGPAREPQEIRCGQTGWKHRFFSRSQSKERGPIGLAVVQGGPAAMVIDALADAPNHPGTGKARKSPGDRRKRQITEVLHTPNLLSSTLDFTAYQEADAFDARTVFRG